MRSKDGGSGVGLSSSSAKGLAGGRRTPSAASVGGNNTATSTGEGDLDAGKGSVGSSCSSPSTPGPQAVRNTRTTRARDCMKRRGVQRSCQVLRSTAQRAIVALAPNRPKQRLRLASKLAPRGAAFQINGPEPGLDPPRPRVVREFRWVDTRRRLATMGSMNLRFGTSRKTIAAPASRFGARNSP